MEYSDKPKKRKLLPRQRPSVIILEVLVVVVAVVAAGRYLFGTPSAPVAPDANALYGQGEIFLEAKDYMQAVDVFTQAIVADYDPVSMAYFQRGLARYNLKEYESAIDDFTLSLKYDAVCEQNCHVDYYNRALSHEKLGDNGAALDDYTSAIAENESYYKAYQNRADLYFRTGNTAAGLRDWQQALRSAHAGKVQRGMTENGGTRQAEIASAGQQVYFTFEGGAADKVTLYTSGATLDSVLMLLDKSGTALAFDDDSAGDESQDARIDSFVLPEDGSYTAVVAAYNAEDTGKFSLSMQVVQPAATAPDMFTRITPHNVETLTEYSQFERSSSGTTAWSADGRFFLENNLSSGVLLYDTAVTDPRYRQVVNYDHYFNVMALNADNTLLALAEDKNVLLYDVETGTRTAVLRDSDAYIYDLAFSPDGTLLAANGGYDSVLVWDTGTGKVARTLTTAVSASSVAFNTDSELLAAGGQDGGIELWNVLTGDLLRTLPYNGSGDVTTLAFSPNGERLAAGTKKGAVLVYDVSSGEVVSEYSVERGTINAVTFSPDGRLIASAGSAGNIALWTAGSTDAAVILTGHEKPVQSLAFREDGRVLSSAGEDGTVRLWRVK